jgi:serine/threonine-protein kinase
MLTGKAPFHGTEPFDRFVTNPLPPRELDPSISRQLQEVIYRALERQHKDRYASAHDFASDLSHMDQVSVANRPELRDSKKRYSPQFKMAIFYASIALLPIVIFVLLLLFAKR